MDKKAVRAMIRQRKRAMTQEEIRERSLVLQEKFLACELYRQARTLYGYMPYNQEVRTQGILRQALLDGKAVALPKVVGDRMDFILVTDLEQVAEGYCGIPEPVADGPVAQDPTALVLMPGLAFDREGRRLGYGGGFYDQFLEREPDHPTLALCYEFQMLDRLETEAHDKTVDCVIWG